MKTCFNLRILSFFLVLGVLSTITLTSCKNNNTETTMVSRNTMETPMVKAPDFELLSTEGTPIRLSDYSGQVVVLHIATTWCPYCNAEAPYLEQLSRDYKDRGVVVLIIDVKEPKALVQEKWVQQHQLSFPVVLDTDGTVAASFAPKEVLPELARDEIMLASNIIIDQNGNMPFMSLLDTKNFDSKLIHVKNKLDELLY
ncbi:peroxiredoxin family protein [Aestuariivivens sediminis]|uniref:peroxiredoxin family protein n=1 Tax=Aestuariivivens sediminis TaxID=2913557 RepID=UPI001F5A0A56|nr:TlpA disulfide reductase family protein [Aestuariivivens sediminis]